ncbi:hypothetical protein FBEOM_1350 [Fusarium beomiforme]|uniref:Uncharacterized protein n=1 Tax=Fusarium beomiforme TaxID=44412 RepID=A0A9P5E5B0_9HYPO|nr:hypothetical protein FBEOM_1350 [Fusarium beomiforme]
MPEPMALLPLMVDTDENLEWPAENVDEQQDEKLLRLSDILWLPEAGDVLYSVQRLDLLGLSPSVLLRWGAGAYSILGNYNTNEGQGNYSPPYVLRSTTFVVIASCILAAPPKSLPQKDFVRSLADQYLSVKSSHQRPKAYEFDYWIAC